MRSPRSILTLSFVLAAAFALSAPAFSQPKASGADDAQQADEHFRKGKDLVNAGRLKEGREEYLAAFRLRRSYDVAGNLGSVELALGFPRDAAEHLSFALHNYAASGTTPEQLERAKQRFAEAERQVGRVKVSVSVEGAEVLVDGKPVGRSLGEDLFVEAGERTIEARLKGYEPARETISIAKGQAVPVTLTLAVVAVAAPTASAVPMASASASASPPPIPTALKPVDSSGGPSKPVLITSGVVTGLAVVAGVVFTVMANSKASDADAKIAEFKAAGLKNPCLTRATDCDAIESDRGAHDSLSNAALVSFVGAGVLAVGTLTYGLMAKPVAATPAQGVRVLPMVGAAQGGVLVVGCW